MDKLGETIRNNLKTRNMTSIDLGVMTGLNPRTIDNIIHGKSRKPSLLRQISVALGIDLLKYQTKKDSKPETADINIDIYSKAANVVGKLIKSENIYVNKNILDSLINLTYQLIREDNTISDKELYYFVKGMVRHGLHSFILNYKTEDLEDTTE